MSPLTPSSLVGRLKQLFAREPAVGVVVFGKSAVVNGHQDMKGDVSEGWLETARLLYYQGFLQFAESELQRHPIDSLLIADLVIRVRDGRVYICVPYPVAEGGSTTVGFAPLVIGVDFGVGLAERLLPLAFSESVDIAPSLGSSFPKAWGDLLAPMRSRLLGQVPIDGKSESGPSWQAMRVALGNDTAGWCASLGVELRLPALAEASVQQATGFVASTDVPRLGGTLVADMTAWLAFMRDATGPKCEWWLVGTERSSSVRVVTGRARPSDLSTLWQPIDRAESRPQVLPIPPEDEAFRRALRWLGNFAGSLGGLEARDQGAGGAVGVPADAMVVGQFPGETSPLAEDGQRASSASAESHPTDEGADRSRKSHAPTGAPSQIAVDKRDMLD